MATLTLAAFAPSATASAAGPPAQSSALNGGGPIGTLAALDLKQECATRAEALTPTGWSLSRFEQCHRRDNYRINLRETNGEYIGFVEVDIWILGFAYDGSRRVDYLASLEDIKMASQLDESVMELEVSLRGCERADLVCPGPTRRTDLIRQWYERPTADAMVVTSPDGAGADPFYTVAFTPTFEFSVRYKDGRTIPWTEDLAQHLVRFDSAGPALGGKYKGTVFPDHTPTFSLSLTGPARQEALHIHDALYNPSRTFPSFIGKSPPGSSPPLHRLMDKTNQDSNHNAAVKVCRDVWGPTYTTGGLECDEYPFKTTYEGAANTTPLQVCGFTAGEPWGWHGSARPIAALDNGIGGNELKVFYGAQRLLDCDPFHVTTVP
ncbi:hypothetical protein [Micromonospora sp. NPDC005174]|uniref:NucA/NucB deoxyribonuclease domain-containing protein n=1 Tax=unclassified Micromonospora TaxID=2617518 RepID=UPI0033B3D82C